MPQVMANEATDDPAPTISAPPVIRKLAMANAISSVPESPRRTELDAGSLALAAQAAMTPPTSRISRGTVNGSVMTQKIAGYILILRILPGSVAR